MSANYKLVRNPNPKGTEEQLPLHPRLVANGTVDMDFMMSRFESRSTFSTADMKGMLQLFQDMIVTHLQEGYNVKIDGIGTFSLSLQSRPEMDKKKIRAESVHFKDVTFRSSKKLRERLITTPLFRDETHKSDPKYLTPQQCEENLTWYMEHNPYIDCRSYMSLNYCGKTKAADELRRFALAGKLQMKRIGTSHLYYKPEQPSPEEAENRL